MATATKSYFAGSITAEWLKSQGAALLKQFFAERR